MKRPTNRPRRPSALKDAGARAEDLYERMGASVDRMKHEPGLSVEDTLEDMLFDIRELLIHLVELVVLSAEEDR